MPLAGRKAELPRKARRQVVAKDGSRGRYHSERRNDKPRLDGYQKPPLLPLRGQLRMRQLDYILRILQSKGVRHVCITLYACCGLRSFDALFL